MLDSNQFVVEKTLQPYFSHCVYVVPLLHSTILALCRSYHQVINRLLVLAMEILKRGNLRIVDPVKSSFYILPDCLILCILKFFKEKFVNALYLITYKGHDH